MRENVFNKPDGRKSKPYTSTDVVHCGYGWTGGENRSTIIKVTMPESITGGVG